MAKSRSIIFQALSHSARADLVSWLKNPRAHFPPQVDGDLVTDGVCAIFIAQKWSVTQPTASRHLKLLVDAGLVVATRKKGWTFYRRNEDALAAFITQLCKEL